MPLFSFTQKPSHVLIWWYYSWSIDISYVYIYYNRWFIASIVLFYVHFQICHIPPYTILYLMFCLDRTARLFVPIKPVIICLKMLCWDIPEVVGQDGRSGLTRCKAWFEISFHFGMPALDLVLRFCHSVALCFADLHLHLLQGLMLRLHVY